MNEDEKMDFSTRPVGVFDSGLGGITVLKEMTRLMPGENLIFYGDSANAPYGEKTTQQIRQLRGRIVDYLLGRGAKAIVVACNTATSAAITGIRAAHPEVPVIGIEPAIKPVALAMPHKRILVMATQNTLSLRKYHALIEKYEDQADFTSLACTGLAARIEQGRFEDEDLMELLHSLLDPYAGKVDAVVLGCTHYPFIRRQIRAVLGDIPLYDGGAGTARELRRELEAGGTLNPAALGGRVEFVSSRNTEEELRLYRALYEMPIEA